MVGAGWADAAFACVHNDSQAHGSNIPFRAVSSGGAQGLTCSDALGGTGLEGLAAWIFALAAACTFAFTAA